MTAKAFGEMVQPAARLPVLALIGARVTQRLGWPGVIGALLLLVGAGWAGFGWHSQQLGPSLESTVAPAPVAIPAAPVVYPPAVPTASMPGRADVPDLLRQVAQLAKRNGLGWPAADYRIVAATAELPSILEVKCALSGGYPDIRRWLEQILSGVPAATLREFSLTRTSADSATVDAKLTIVIFLEEDAASLSGNPSTRESPRR